MNRLFLKRNNKQTVTDPAVILAGMKMDNPRIYFLFFLVALLNAIENFISTLSVSVIGTLYLFIMLATK